jgi:hypothetical protein
MTPVSELKPMDVFVHPHYCQDHSVYMGFNTCYITGLGLIDMPYNFDEVEVIGKMRFVSTQPEFRIVLVPSDSEVAVFKFLAENEILWKYKDYLKYGAKAIYVQSDKCELLRQFRNKLECKNDVVGLRHDV